MKDERIKRNKILIVYFNNNFSITTKKLGTNIIKCFELFNLMVFKIDEYEKLLTKSKQNYFYLKFYQQIQHMKIKQPLLLLNSINIPNANTITYNLLIKSIINIQNFPNDLIVLIERHNHFFPKSILNNYKTLKQSNDILLINIVNYILDQ